MNKFAKWDTTYINSLPDAAFAVIEPAYTRGETEDKNCRHLPHHSDGVKDGSDSNDHIDIDHLRNAWQRRNQIVPVTDSISQDELRSKAERHLKKHINDLDLGWGEDTLDLIPGQYSLSKNGTGKIRLIALVESGTAVQQPPRSSPSQPLAPSDSEFFRARFRALSQIIIENYAIDFTQEGVLEKSVPLLKNQTVYTDHNVDVHNWIGVVENSLWDKESSPAGVDADIKIDKQNNPKIVRGLTIDPPAIHSCSVTVFFTWHKSHPDLSDDFFDPDSFWWLLGTEKDGELVRVIVDEITQYGELSLVWQGADPYAKRKLQSRLKSIKDNFGFRASNFEIKNQGGLMTDQEIKAMQEANATLQKENQTFKAENETLKPSSALGKKYLDQLRKETESLYRLLKADKADEQYVKTMIQTAPAENLETLKKDFETSLAQKTTFTCPHCQKPIAGLRASHETKPADDDKATKIDADQHKV
jgi:cell division protein FtsB